MYIYFCYIYSFRFILPLRAGRTRALRHGTIREFSPPTLGATLPRTEFQRPDASLVELCVRCRPDASLDARAGLEPLSYWSGRTIEFSPAHEGRD